MRVSSKFKRLASKVISLSVLTLLLVVTAQAYTVVMRGGRRIEIPSRFIVTPSTLTYEVSSGIQVTLAMSAIDIPATEKANNELPGSLLRRAQLESETRLKETDEQNKVISEARQARERMSARRTITNRDLEATARRRRESESAYENRIKQLGLPTLEESRRRAATSSDLIQSELEQKRLSERESENYWRARASALRTEIAALDAEIHYIRMKLEEGSSPTWNTSFGGSFTSVISVLPFINFGGRSFGGFSGRHFGAGSGMHRPGIVMGPQGGIVMGPQGGSIMGPSGGTQIRGRIGFGGGNRRGHILLNPGHFPHARTVIGSPVIPWPNVTVVGSTLPAYDFSYERGALITRFNELGAARAGLSARWRELEDEARRAGVPPGWLRP